MTGIMADITIIAALLTIIQEVIPITEIITDTIKEENINQKERIFK